MSSCCNLMAFANLDGKVKFLLISLFRCWDVRLFAYIDGSFRYELTLRRYLNPMI